MAVEQKLNSHLVPEVNKARQATSEFKNFAIVSWNELVKSGTNPQTWDRLKLAIQSRFVPHSYKRDIHRNCNSSIRVACWSRSIIRSYERACYVVVSWRRTKIKWCVSMGGLTGTFRT
jgi:hypothetical protein